MQAIATGTVTTPKPSSKNKVKANMLAYRGMILYRFITGGCWRLSTGYTGNDLDCPAFYRQWKRCGHVRHLIGFSLNAAAFIWVFMVNKTLKATLGIAIPGVLLYIAYKLSGN